MHILNNLKSYLYDQKFVVNIYDNHLYLFNYVKLIKLSDTNLKINFDKFDLEPVQRPGSFRCRPPRGKWSERCP